MKISDREIVNQISSLTVGQINNPGQSTFHTLGVLNAALLDLLDLVVGVRLYILALLRWGKHFSDIRCIPFFFFFFFFFFHEHTTSVRLKL